MGQPDVFLTVNSNVSTTTLNATTATSALAIGKRKKFSIAASGPFHYLLGSSGVSAAAATDPYVVSSIVLNSGQNTHVRIYNPGASAITYSLVTYGNV